MTEVTEFCERHGATTTLVVFAIQFQTLAEVWNACHRSDWMLWMLRKSSIKIPRSTLRKFACKCVRETPLSDGRKVWDLLTDKRSRNAIEVAELYADGKASRDELRAADADAVSAAYATDCAVDGAAHAAAEAAAEAAADAAATVVVDLVAGWAVEAAGACDTVNCGAAREAARSFQADLLRSMIPNPFSKE